MTDLQGKRALVTGAARGIGAAIARTLAERGADVAITYEKSADKAADVVRSIEAAGRKGIAIQADSADETAIRRAVDETVSALGGLDILVNNAGIARYGALEETDIKDLDALIAVNIRGVVLASAAAIPHLPEGGRIVSIGSVLGSTVPSAGSTLYSMTKSALLSLNKGLARDLGPRGITVNLVSPGPIDTDMNPADGESAEGIRKLTALGRYGKPDDIAQAVAFLAGPGAGYVTGAVLAVDGGSGA